jgi:hypothetical protein
MSRRWKWAASGLMLIGLTYFLDGWMDNTSGFCRGFGPSEYPDHHHLLGRHGFPLGLHL